MQSLSSAAVRGDSIAFPGFKKSDRKIEDRKIADFPDHLSPGFEWNLANRGHQAESATFASLRLCVSLTGRFCVILTRASRKDAKAQRD
jgi:hypothetical protein